MTLTIEEQDKLLQDMQHWKRFIDVSSWNENILTSINADTLKKARIDGVYIKATQDTDYVNHYAYNVAGHVKSLDLLIGYYDFVSNWDISPNENIAFFSKVISDWPRSAGVMLDVEVMSAKGVDHMNKWIQAWTDLADQFAKYVFVYTNPWFLDQGIQIPKNARLWLAEWSLKPTIACDAWQSGTIDLDDGRLVADFDLINI